MKAHGVLFPHGEVALEPACPLLLTHLHFLSEAHSVPWQVGSLPLLVGVRAWGPSRTLYLPGLGGGESQAGGGDTELANTSITPSWNRIHTCLGVGGCVLLSVPHLDFSRKDERPGRHCRGNPTHTPGKWHLELRPMVWKEGVGSKSG